MWTGAFFLVLKNYGMWSCRNHGSRNPESGKVLVHNPSQYGWDFFREKNRILFFSKILKEGVFDYLNSLTQADLERTKKYSDIEWSEALNEEAKRMPGFADTLIKKTEIESKAKGKVEGKAEKTVEVVRNMQKEGFSPEMIAKIVQKSVATVKSMML